MRDGCRATSTPSIWTLPLVALSSPQMIESVVVLPAPFGPSRPKISPSRTSRSSPFTVASSLPR